MWLHSCNIIPAYSWQNIATASWRSVSTCPIVGLKPFKISAWKATKLTNKTKNENMMSESMLVCPLRAISPQPCFKHLQVNPLLTRKMSVYGTGHFLSKSLPFCEKTETTNSPEIKIETDLLCDATTVWRTQNAAVEAATCWSHKLLHARPTWGCAFFSRLFCQSHSKNLSKLHAAEE